MLLRHHFPVPGDDAVEVVLLQRIQSLDPVLRIAVVHERHPVDQRIAGRDDLLAGQIDEHVAVGVAATQLQDLDVAASLGERDRGRQRARRQRGFELFQLFEIGLGLAQVGFEPGLLRGVAGPQRYRP